MACYVCGPDKKYQKTYCPIKRNERSLVDQFASFFINFFRFLLTILRRKRRQCDQVKTVRCQFSIVISEKNLLNLNLAVCSTFLFGRKIVQRFWLGNLNNPTCNSLVSIAKRGEPPDPRSLRGFSSFVEEVSFFLHYFEHNS